MKSDAYIYGTKEYFRARVIELEHDRDVYKKEANYYQTELAKIHKLLGRVIHQLSERRDSVRLTKYFPTDNLFNKRILRNPEGIEENSKKN